MIITEEMYGADADGNRGVKMIECELEYTKMENEEIAEILADSGYSAEDDYTTTVEYMGHDVEVDISEYTDELTALGAYE